MRRRGHLPASTNVARLLPHREANLFFRLQKTLLCFVNQQVRVSGELLSLEDFAVPRTEEMLKVRDELIQKPELLDSFLQQNPADLSGEELNTFLRGGIRLPAPFTFFGN